jgi:hypothetical protein
MIMEEQNTISRRLLVKSSVFGVLVAAIPNILYSRTILGLGPPDQKLPLPERHPAIPLDVASEVVGVSHFNFDRLKELVEPRPELARASWDWGYGDWESALDAASHVGRKDMVDYLIGKGAVPTIFTLAMLGHYETVKAMIDAYPGTQKKLGPHGISLLHHAKLAMDMEGVDKGRARQLIDHLQQLGDSDGQPFLMMEDAEKQKFLGDYTYGKGPVDGFTVKLNMQKLLSLGRLGKSGGTLLKTGENEFAYKGAPSVFVTFKVEGDTVISITVTEPGLTLTAAKVEKIK